MLFIVHLVKQFSLILSLIRAMSKMIFTDIIFLYSGQESCPDPLTTADITPCPSGDGVCRLTCTDDLPLSAPVPYYIPCGVLGVWNYQKPSETLVLPNCAGKTTLYTPGESGSADNLPLSAPVPYYEPCGSNMRKAVM